MCVYTTTQVQRIKTTHTEQAITRCNQRRKKPGEPIIMCESMDSMIATSKHDYTAQYII